MADILQSGTIKIEVIWLKDDIDYILERLYVILEWMFAIYLVIPRKEYKYNRLCA